MTLRCVLWDFGDTLVDERWLQRAPVGVPQWPDVWKSLVRGELADRWNTGELTLGHVVDAVASTLPMSREAIGAHIGRCCAEVAFFPAPLAVARASRLPQAIVTINPDAFTQLVVPRYALDATFAPIVTSWQQRTLDKADLADIALRSIDGDIARAEALLIDNVQANVERWIARGGRAYHFRGEARFREDPRRELRDLAVTAEP